MKCGKCIKTIRDLDHVSPVGWSPFAWGVSSAENPIHFYCFPEDISESDSDCAQELPVTALCEIENPIKRLVPFAV